MGRQRPLCVAAPSRPDRRRGRSTVPPSTWKARTTTPPTTTCCIFFSTFGDRDGDDDTGWQLKVPDAEGRIEIRTTLADAPPSELEKLLTGLRLGKVAGHVATIRTKRTRYRIREPEESARVRRDSRRPGTRIGGARAARVARDRRSSTALDARSLLLLHRRNGSARRALGRRAIRRSWHTRCPLRLPPEVDGAVACWARRTYAKPDRGDLRRGHAASART